MPNLPWFDHYPRSQRRSLQLYCFPYAGGSAQVFSQWQRQFQHGIDLCLVNLPGRGKRIAEPLMKRLTPLVQSIADAFVRELQEYSSPFALFGHSMGAVISFELARELRRRGAPEPAHLFVAGRHAPQLPDPDPITFNLSHDLFIAELRKLNGTPTELLEDPELLELYLPVIRADFELIQTYEYNIEEPLACPITSYGGLQDSDVPLDSIRAWAEQTSSKFTARMFPGDHFFIRDPKFVSVFHQDVVTFLSFYLSRSSSV